MVISEPRRRTQIKRYGHDESVVDMSELDSSADDSDDETGGSLTGRGTFPACVIIFHFTPISFSSIHECDPNNNNIMRIIISYNYNKNVHLYLKQAKSEIETNSIRNRASFMMNTYLAKAKWFMVIGLAANASK